jgi:Domain of unknown function (DUF4157)
MSILIFNCLIVILSTFAGVLIMPEHKQTQQSKELKPTFQKRAPPAKQMPISNPSVIIQCARIYPKSLTHTDVMQLQLTIGNRAVNRLLSEIGLIPSKAKQGSAIQMQTIPDEEKEPLQGKMVETLQRQEIPEEEEPLQGKFEGQPEQEKCPSCPKLPTQREEKNLTGMPDNLKDGVENLSGLDMSDVKVHYNSPKPVEVGAWAYTQGTNIHISPGQEGHLPHEAWHVVQQKQGRVLPTIQLKDVAVNDDAGLEHEADEMGKKAWVNIDTQKPKATQQTTSAKSTIPYGAHFGQSREVNSIHCLQHTIGSKAVQCLLQAKAEELDANSVNTASSRLAHDFSQIPTYPKESTNDILKIARNRTAGTAGPLPHPNQIQRSFGPQHLLVANSGTADNQPCASPVIQRLEQDLPYVGPALSYLNLGNQLTRAILPGLSSSQKALLDGIFGNSLATSLIRLNSNSTLATGNCYRTTGNIINMPGTTIDDSDLIHEAAHVWQSQNTVFGVGYAVSALRAQAIAQVLGGDWERAYDYHNVERYRIPWRYWNAEQQAKWIQDNRRLPSGWMLQSALPNISTESTGLE